MADLHPTGAFDSLGTLGAISSHIFVFVFVFLLMLLLFVTCCNIVLIAAIMLITIC